MTWHSSQWPTKLRGFNRWICQNQHQLNPGVLPGSSPRDTRILNPIQPMGSPSQSMPSAEASWWFKAWLPSIIGIFSKGRPTKGHALFSTSAEQPHYMCQQRPVVAANGHHCLETSNATGAVKMSGRFSGKIMMNSWWIHVWLMVWLIECKLMVNWRFIDGSMVNWQFMTIVNWRLIIIVMVNDGWRIMKVHDSSWWSIVILL